MKTSTRAFLRLWRIQATFNPRGLQQSGLLDAFAPWLATLPESERDAFLDGEPAHRNTSAVMAGWLVGARIRAHREAGPDHARRLADALQSACGAIGDDLHWGAFRPATRAVALWTAWQVGLAEVVVVASIAGSVELGLRLRGLRKGLEAGTRVVDVIRADPWVQSASRWRALGGFVTAAFAVGLVASAVGPLLDGGSLPDLVLPASALVLGALWSKESERVRAWTWPMVVAILVVIARVTEGV